MLGGWWWVMCGCFLPARVAAKREARHPCHHAHVLFRPGGGNRVKKSEGSGFGHQGQAKQGSKGGDGDEDDDGDGGGGDGGAGGNGNRVARRPLAWDAEGDSAGASAASIAAAAALVAAPGTGAMAAAEGAVGGGGSGGEAEAIRRRVAGDMAAFRLWRVGRRGYWPALSPQATRNHPHIPSLLLSHS